VDAARLRQMLRGHLGRAQLYRVRGRYAEAERELRTAVGLAEREATPPTAELAEAASALGVLLEALGKPADAEGALRLAVRVYERTCGPRDGRLAAPLSALGAVCQLRGDLAEAERLYRRALAVDTDRPHGLEGP
jgi:Flp pilus assembly protein TadD